MNLFLSFYNKICLRKKNIFVVEDNKIYSKSLHGFLTTRFPYAKIEIFSNGEACLIELHKNPTIVIMDYLLNADDTNAADGLSIIQKIKASSHKTNTILLSAQTDLDVFVKAISIYVCTYLRKDEQAFKKVDRFVKEIFHVSKYPSL